MTVFLKDSNPRPYQSHRWEVTGDCTEQERKEIDERVKHMMLHHPQLLAGYSLTFRYNRARVFIIPISPSDLTERNCA